MVGAMNSESFQTYHSYANTFEMPIVVPWYPVKSEKVSEVRLNSDCHLFYYMRQNLWVYLQVLIF